MRVAQVAQLLMPIPPVQYGGIERSISFITEALVREGHDVTLFATADSHTSARLIPCAPTGLRQADPQAAMLAHMLMLEQVFKHADQFDVIHNHIEFFVSPFARRHATPVVTTLHKPLHPATEPIYREYREQHLVAISDFQREQPFPDLNWAGTVHHGLPENLYTFQEQPGQYLAFLGRLSPVKGLPDAIEIATRAGIPLKVAGNRDFFDPQYFEELKPLLEHPLVEYVGEVNDQQKQELLGNALALLFPVTWHEPFGLVLIEALACGTPVIARRRGAVPEIIAHGTNGFHFETVEEAVKLVEQIGTISRTQCRASFEDSFTDTRMAQRYVDIFEHLRGH